MKIMKNVSRVILDTNFIVDLFRFRLSFEDVEDVVGTPCSFLTVRQSVGELERIKTKYARLGLELIDSGKIKVIDAAGRTADDAILSLLTSFKKARGKDGIRKTAVATNDAGLRKRIKALDIKVIYLRARKHLEIN